MVALNVSQQQINQIRRFPSIPQTPDSLITLDRMLAARKLAWFGPAAETAVPALIEALKDEDLVEDAATTLGKIGPGAKDAIPALKAVPEDNLYKYYAEEAIEKITAQ